MATHLKLGLQARGAQVSGEEFSRYQDMVERMLTSLPEPLVLASAAPSTPTAPGEAGEFFFDASYLYLCVATDAWRRVALSTW